MIVSGRSQVHMAKFYKIPLAKPYFPRAALSGDNLEFWIGRKEQIDRVVRGLLAATGAHYLITGYPGVGKSSFVSRVVAEWRKLSADKGISRVLIFNLHFAQPQSPEEVVKRLIGKVYFGSLDGQFSPAKKLAERLQLNYIQAYSKTLKETRAETTSYEAGREATVNLPQTLFGGSLGATSRKTKGISRSLEIQKEYNLSVAISDFEASLHLLTQAESFQPKFFDRLKRLLFRVKGELHSSRILFIFDQIDDLKFVEELSSFFNIANASFIVLGGIKLQAQLDSEKEKGVQGLDNFEQIYLPCQWNQAGEALSMLVDQGRISARKYVEYTDYLNFCSQGLPRRLFAAIDRHVRRDEDEFYLGLRPSEQKRVKLCAELHRILWKHRKDILGSHIDSVQEPSRDKALRGAYHLTDQIFRVAKFSFQEANTVATQISETIIHPKRERVLRNLLNLFENYGLLVRDGNSYRLSETILERVKQIPNWLKDGYVDAQEFINEIRTVEEKDTPLFVDIRLARKGERKAQGRDNQPSHSDPIATDEERQDQADSQLYLSSMESTTSPEPKLLNWGSLVGQQLAGRYTIEDELGRGGMGAVYLARDQKLIGKRVVVKVLQERFLQNKWVMSKFQHEVEALARIDHVGIVGILDTGELPDGKPYIVMQYVDGLTLRSVLRSGGMNIRRVAHVLEQAADALGEAHEKRILHRDLKPENIMLQLLGGGREQVKIIDFGVAKVRDSMLAPETAASATAGTTLYMSPEQLSGALKLSPASDIYSLGLITYEMVTGLRPFNPQSPFQLLEMQRLGVKVLPRDLRPELPEAAQEAILKALNFNPDERYQRTTDFSEDFVEAVM